MYDEIIIFFSMILIWLSLLITKYILYPNKIDNKLDRFRADMCIHILHAVSISLLSIIALFYQNKFYYSIVSIWSLSYFSIDLFNVIYDRDYIFILHHLISILGITFVNIFESNNLPLLNICFFTELSTPFLYRWKITKLIDPITEYRKFKEFGLIFILVRPIFLFINMAISLNIKYLSISFILYSMLFILNFVWGIGIIQLGLNYKKPEIKENILNE